MREPLERQYFDERIRPLLGGNIEYLGELNAEEKYQLLGGAFALLNPIQWPEPFGLVMIEALACGTPVVATPCGSAPEIVANGETGFLRSELSSLAAALNHARELDRSRCRETAVSCFGTSRMVDAHVGLYTRLLEADRKDRGGRFMDDAEAAGVAIGPYPCASRQSLRRAIVPPGASGRDCDRVSLRVCISRRSAVNGVPTQARRAARAVGCHRRGSNLQQPQPDSNQIASVTSPRASGDTSGSASGALHRATVGDLSSSILHVALCLHSALVATTAEAAN